MSAECRMKAQPTPKPSPGGEGGKRRRATGDG